jgi:hypothetical protein
MLTSDVWHYLDALSKDVKGKPVRYGARCKFCKKELSGKSISGSTLLHQRCACHIINLIVKSGLKCLKLYLEDFMTAISFLNSSNQRIASLKSFCLAARVCHRKFGLDMDVRWNSTYLMLKHLLSYKDTFSVFIHTNYRGGTLLTLDHWYVAEHILQFLEQFYLSTVSLSGIYYSIGDACYY